MANRVCPQCGRKFLEGEAFCPFDGARLRDVAPAAGMPAGVGDPLIGKLLDNRYQVERVLGSGGMGTVYAAKQVALNKPVAIKVLRPVEDDGGQALARFEREAKSASNIGEEHIINIFDFGKSPDGLSYLVMELLEGRDLGDMLESQRTLPLPRALGIVLQCCQALGAAHAAGIVHRDLKPENIFLINRDTNPDFVKIVDFGLAKITDTETIGEPGRKLTKTGMIFGTPHYMSPEACMGRPTDHRADIYALGVIFYEMLAGDPPFDGENFMGILNQHMMDPPPPIREVNPAIHVPVALEAVIYRCMDKKAGQRPDSMQGLSDEIVGALRESGMASLADHLVGSVDVAEPQAFMNLTKKKKSIRPPAPAMPPGQSGPHPMPTEGSGAHPMPSGPGGVAYAATMAMQAPVAQRPSEHPHRQASPRRAVSEHPLPPSTPPSTPPRPSRPTPRTPRLESHPAAPRPAERSPMVLVLGGLLLLLVGGALGYGVLMLLK